MHRLDTIVIGASAGGLVPLQTIVAQLPAQLPAAVFVVLHISPDSPSALPAILGRAAQMPVVHPTDGEPIRYGQVYVAPPNRHLLLTPDYVRLAQGPRENRQRPSIDALFRSAAIAVGPRVIGVVLSGTLDDGTAGLWAIKDQGGRAIVQQPADALQPAMPSNALANVPNVDLVLPSTEIAGALRHLSGASAPSDQPSASTLDLQWESGTTGLNPQSTAIHNPIGAPSRYACPECHGVLNEIREGTIVRYRCRTGHGFTLANLLAEQRSSAEAALFSAQRAMLEYGELLGSFIQRSQEHGDESAAAASREALAATERHARAIQQILDAMPGSP